MERTILSDSPAHIGQKIKVYGWVNSYRAHGKLIFVDLRDRTGLAQVVFTPNSAGGPEVYQLAKKLRPEWVVEVIGIVASRPQGTVNNDLVTGQIEIQAESLKVLSRAKTLPFSIHDDGYEINEEKRLKYRYLDLRRERLKNNLLKRQEVIHYIRDFLKKKDFIEVETPILTKSTPEGARDFVVPSRLQAGKFYALPQSPQQYKQLLMVGGLEQYFQIAKCFRDEDPRADRQAEFTQLDIEMSFVEQDNILQLIEELMIRLVQSVFPNKIIAQIPFPRITYKDAIQKYHNDRPDLRKNKKDNNQLAFAFVVNFPMFEWSKEDRRWKTMHHPFTRPQTEDIALLKKDPKNILAYQYDLVLNGYEVGGGSLRSYKPEVLEAVFEILGHKKEEIQEKFGHLLEAFQYGVPPHGGIALGLDRLLSILLNEPNIREVIPFPKTGDSRDPMMDSPSYISPAQLKELHIKIEKTKK